ncbi:MAG: hypothetical protein AB1491_06895 [Thermodesulfobacteriota bacterium]
MSCQVIPLELARRRPPPPRKLGEVYGRVLRLDRLSPEVMERHIQRQALREMDLLNFLIKMNGGYLPPIPNEDQIKAFYEDGLEY